MKRPEDGLFFLEGANNFTLLDKDVANELFAMQTKANDQMKSTMLCWVVNSTTAMWTIS